MRTADTAVLAAVRLDCLQALLRRCLFHSGLQGPMFFVLTHTPLRTLHTPLPALPHCRWSAACATPACPRAPPTAARRAVSGGATLPLLARPLLALRLRSRFPAFIPHPVAPILHSHATPMYPSRAQAGTPASCASRRRSSKLWANTAGWRRSTQPHSRRSCGTGAAAALWGLAGAGRFCLADSWEGRGI